MSPLCTSSVGLTTPPAPQPPQLQPKPTEKGIASRADSSGILSSPVALVGLLSSNSSLRLSVGFPLVCVLGLFGSPLFLRVSMD